MRRVILLCFCLLPLSAAAQTQTDMTNQAHVELTKADAQLNRVYKQLVAKLDDSSKKQLVTAQQAWVKFRDADADAHAAINEGGTIYPMIHDLSAAQTTKLRTGQLKDWLKEVQSK